MSFRPHRKHWLSPILTINSGSTMQAHRSAGPSVNLSTYEFVNLSEATHCLGNSLPRTPMKQILVPP